MMSEIPTQGPNETKESTNWQQCVLCQTVSSSKGPLVLQPRLDSYQRLLQTIEERASLQDGDFVQIHRRLHVGTNENVLEKRAVWHRTCYSNATNKDQIQRARDHQEHNLSIGSYSGKKRGQKRKSTDIDEPPTSDTAPFTRSATVPFNKDHCFFCQEDDGQHLFTVRTENSGKALRDALEISQDAILKTRLNTSIAPCDAHAIDVQYHKSCWTKHVFHVLRDRDTHTDKDTYNPMQISSLIELLNLIDVQTQNKAYLSMEDIETTYVNMLGGTDALATHSPAFSRKWLKEKILFELPNVTSVRQKDRRKCAILYSPDACQEDMVHSVIAADKMDDMSIIYKAAKLLRKSIADFKKNHTPSESDSIQVTSGAEVYAMLRWVMVGPAEELENEKRTNLVDRAVLTLSQNVMYGCKSRRQVNYAATNDCSPFRSHHSSETPQSLGLAIKVHHDTRNKKLLNILSAQGYCVPYSRVMLLETALANAVVENTKQFQGLYVPPFLRKDAFVFFAADNTDFAEDSADGKGTTHGTVITVYQKADASGDSIAPPLHVTDAHSLSVTPYHVPVIQCKKPLLPQSTNRVERFTINKNGISPSYRLTHFGWVMASVITRMRESNSSFIPGWAGYNSLLSASLPLTQVGVFPLLPEVAHEWSTLVTVLSQATQLKNLAVGDKHPTVISFDMALYEKVIQLQDSQPALKDTVTPRLGELHAAMAALRALGASIENSGIDDAWIEADVYGSATTRQILKCSHYKRSLRAHIYSYIALYELVLELFFDEYPHLKASCSEVTDEISDACSKVDKCKKAESVKDANAKLLQVITTADVVNEFKTWEAQRSKHAMFKSLMNYLHRVETILCFVAASRNADFGLHLEAGEELSKLFFSMDRIKYKRLWPRYIADMYDLKKKHPDTYRELEAGNISVTKSSIPFVSIGADHACEQENKIMKVHSGLIGISNNANARQRFFLATPELSRISREFSSQFEDKADEVREHHELGPSAVRRDHRAVDKIKAAILSHGNPFAVEGNAIHNLITQAYLPEEHVAQILNIDETGQRLYEEFVEERINGSVSLFAPVKKENNKMYLSGNKKTKVMLRGKAVDLKETKDLYGRLMVLAKSSREIDQKHAIGNFEFTLTPRAFFAPNGVLLPCTDKSKLIHLLVKLGDADPNMPQTDEHHALSEDGVLSAAAPEHTDIHEATKKIAVVDGMVLVQKLTTKAATIVTVKDLSVSFNALLMSLARDYDEIILVFDTYKADSLKRTTRDKRRDGQDSVQYQVNDNTRIQHITMKRFLSHEQTKADLTEYLAEKTLEFNKDSPKLVIVCADGSAKSNSDLQFEDNNHEEADTLMIHQAVLATRRCPTAAQLTFFSPDTDVLVLVIAYYDMLITNTSVSMVSGLVQVEPIWNSLGVEKARALPAFHAFSGADNTGRFSRIGKTTWFRAYIRAQSDVIQALKMLDDAADVTSDQMSKLITFVCDAYSPKGVHICNIPELRWHLFCKHMAESDKLPPTPGALNQHVDRVHIQARIWGQASVAQQEFLDPQQHGYFRDTDGQLKPLMTDVPPAPKAILEMVRCQCKGDCSSQRCSCHSKDLTCTDLCLCGSQCQNDDDSQRGACTDDSDDDF